MTFAHNRGENRWQQKRDFLTKKVYPREITKRWKDQLEPRSVDWRSVSVSTRAQCVTVEGTVLQPLFIRFPHLFVSGKSMRPQYPGMQLRLSEVRADVERGSCLPAWLTTHGSVLRGESPWDHPFWWHLHSGQLNPLKLQVGKGNSKHSFRSPALHYQFAHFSVFRVLISSGQLSSCSTSH